MLFKEGGTFSSVKPVENHCKQCQQETSYRILNLLFCTESSQWQDAYTSFRVACVTPGPFLRKFTFFFCSADTRGMPLACSFVCMFHNVAVLPFLNSVWCWLDYTCKTAQSQETLCCRGLYFGGGEERYFTQNTYHS